MAINCALWSVLIGLMMGHIAFAADGPNATPEENHLAPDTWAATDGLGRTLPTSKEVGLPRAGRYVGIFYFLTHGGHGDTLPGDIAQIMAKDPDVLSKPQSPLWGTHHAYYWGEPLCGYYSSIDPWVLRRHAQLLSDAGVDTIIFDTTNRATYRPVYMQLCQVWEQMRSEREQTPQLCFMVNTRAGETAQEIFKDLYEPGLYKDLWFHWQGKPLMICDPNEASPEVKGFFTLRKAHWPFELVDTHNEWHWESTFPQVYSYDTDPAKPEEVNVAVAQNLRCSDGRVTNMSEGDARGRSFHHGAEDSSAGAVNQGFNFQEQWDRAIKLDPPFVMVTGWNEWTAGRYSRPGRPVVFVDQFNQEYSRDIEPVTGLHQDNYYYQLVSNVRRYKGARAIPPASAAKSIDVNGSFDQWTDVGPTFAAHAFDTDPRDFGSGALHYVNKTARNMITTMRVARDATNVYFYAKTSQPITAMSDPGWMLVLIDSDNNPKSGWNGYDFIVNRSIEGNQSWLEQNIGGWNWKKVAPVQLKVEANQLMLRIPRAALGLPPGSNMTLDFKWWDNPQKLGDIMDTYLSGDAAPEGRFNFPFRTE